MTARKLLLLLVGLPAVLVLGLILYLELADLSGWSGVIGRAASERIGRDLTIAGRVQADVGGVTRLVFEDVALANASWSEEPAMARVDRIEISLGLWSLVSRPVRIHQVRIEGSTLWLETNSDGRGNWELPPTPGESAGQPSSGRPELVVEELELAEANLRIDTPSRREPPMRSSSDSWLG